MPRSTPLILALALALAGCRSAPAPPPAMFGPVQPATGGISLVEARPFLVASSGEASRRFEIVSGDEAGRARLVVVRAHDEQNILVRTSMEGGEVALSVQSFAISEDGDLISWRETNYPREVFTEFKPPMIVFPRELLPDRPVTQSLEFIVHPLSDRQKVKQRGRAEVSISLVGTQSLSLPEGTAQALRVQTTLAIDFGPARVERTLDQWFLPGVGLIADSYDEEIKVLGVTTEHTTQTAVADPMPAR